ncbi:hypothetical protein OGATHE_006505 [Ogataea polymorpha]|uniref:Uncharacterized protein n=1 Tax=Ogataea polymorpha TaxID=460523 RepID=A0A9P8NSS9_9ASCO|nr:hypothetical protein OGATHE_006505 [Ogataea polymorpha]
MSGTYEASILVTVSQLLKVYRTVGVAGRDLELPPRILSLRDDLTSSPDFLRTNGDISSYLESGSDTGLPICSGECSLSISGLELSCEGGGECVFEFKRVLCFMSSSFSPEKLDLEGLFMKLIDNGKPSFEVVSLERVG